MQLKTLLNSCHRIKGFVYENVHLERMSQRIMVDVRARSKSKPICSVCGSKAPGYDTTGTVRKYQFVPIWGHQCFLRYEPRRVNCPRCGVKVEQVPWSTGKRPLCREYELFLARWAQRLSENFR